MNDNYQSESKEIATLVDLLWQRAKRNPRQIAYTFLANGEDPRDSISYADLHCKARTIGAVLQRQNAQGERVLLLYPPGIEFIAAFFGCLYAGAIAVPAYPPDPAKLARTLPRLESIVKDAQAKLLLTDRSIVAMLKGLALRERSLALLKKLPIFRSLISHSGNLDKLSAIASDSLDKNAAADWQQPDLVKDTLAFMQYTSGSTGSPKGVMLSHANLLHNQEMIKTAFSHDENAVIIGWLPLYHDMGLIGNVLQPMYLGASCYLMSPLAFLQKPLRWLDAISRYRGTTSGGPNFAYEICMRKVDEQQRAKLDLCSWSVAFNGAEPVRPETMERFAAYFAPCGFDRRAFYPCYGLAEASLIVSGGWRDREAVVRNFSDPQLRRGKSVEVSKGGRPLAGSGHPLRDNVLIVDPNTLEPKADRQVGEIWVNGPSVACGYWQKQEESTRDFRARTAGKGPFLRSGDLGFMHKGELFVTGRIKDMVIIRGRNFYPQDIESLVQSSHEAMRPGCGAAFSAEIAGEEKLIIVQEIRSLGLGRGRKMREVIVAVRREVAEEFGIQPYAVVLVKARTILKTSSGKIRRRACREAFLNNELSVLAGDVLDDNRSEDEKGRVDGQKIFACKPRHRAALVQEFLCEQAARALNIAVEQLLLGHSLSSQGLDSLTSMEFQNCLENELGVTLSFSELSRSSIVDLRKIVLARLKESSPRTLSLAVCRSRKIALSHGQRALYFMESLNPVGALYNISRAARVSGDLNVSALENALQELLERHDLLRATFPCIDGTPVQEIQAKGKIDFECSEIGEMNEFELETRLAKEAYRPFDLEKGPLLRLKLYRRCATEHVMLLVIHHIIADLWSLEVFLSELEALYLEKNFGTPAFLPQPKARYDDYVHRQDKMLGGTKGESFWNYWKEQLGELPLLDLPVDHSRPILQSYHGDIVSFGVDEKDSRLVKQLAKKRGTTLYTVLLAAFQVLLHRHSQQSDLIVGSPAAGRSSVDFAGVIGYFVNMIALRSRVTREMTFLDFLEQTHYTVLKALDFQNYPFSELAKRLEQQRDPRRSPIFQATFSMQKGRGGSLAGFALECADARMKMADLELKALPLEQRVSLFDIGLTMAETEDGLKGVLHYNVDLFDPDTVAGIVKNFLVLLRSIATAPEQHVAKLPVLSVSKRMRLEKWNETSVDFTGGCIHQLFEEQARRSPKSVAAVFKDAKISYRELDRRSNQLARHLQKLGAGPEKPVAIYLERSLEMLVAMLGIQKAGAPYLPLDPAYPGQRLAFMLKDSRTSLLLSEETLAQTLPPHNARCVYLQESEILKESVEALKIVVNCQNLAYIIYTSGSTGIPKGVQIEHCSAVNFLSYMQHILGLTSGDVMLALTTLSFDISLLEMFLPLISGACVAIADRRTTSDGELLQEKLLASGATVMQATPATWKLLFESGWQGDMHLKALCGGEAMPVDLGNRLRSTCATVYNLYGPTEATVWSCIYKLGKGKREIPIGRPIANTQIHILDSGMQPVSIGVCGEIYIGGAGLSRGYLQRPALTAEHFVPDPFSDKANARLYRTGDLARYLPDGEIEFIGRVDHQVKVRGFRIELGEIETVLRGNSQVRDAVVIVEGDAVGKHLTACVLPEGKAPKAEQLREYLKDRLPGYMVPAVFLFLDSMALTPSGKLDRSALAKIGKTQLEQERTTPPATMVEEKLATIWERILKVKGVGKECDFFELGGHSLLATQVVSRIKKAFGIELPLRAIFEYPTLSKLASEIEGLRGVEKTLLPIEPVSRGDLPLSFAQQRLWFLQQLEPESPAYNMPAAFLIEGPLDVAQIKYAFAKIVERHEILRTIFPAKAGKPRQKITKCSFEPVVCDYLSLPQKDRKDRLQEFLETEAKRPFDLATGPLFRVFIICLEKERHALLVNMHHLISDGWSLGIMIRELDRLYCGNELSEIALQYADFACWQRKTLGNKISDQLDYWKQNLEGLAPLELPLDFSRPKTQTYRGERESIEIEKTLCDVLDKLGRSCGATMFMTLLAAFKVMLAKYTRREDIAVATPIAGRVDSETETMIGFFVNTLVLRTDLSGDPTFAQLLTRVRKTALNAYSHQDAPFEKLVETLRPQRDLSRLPFTQLMFNFIEYNDNITLAGLKTSPIKLPEYSKFDITLYARECEKSIELDMLYNADLFSQETISAMLAQLHQLLQNVASFPDRKISRLSLLDERKKRELIACFNSDLEAEAKSDKYCSLPDKSDLLDWFERSATHFAKHIAIEWRGMRLTYRQVDRMSDRLAQCLSGLPKTGFPVAVLLRDKMQLAVSLLSTLKSGNVYVPLNPEFPDRRLSQMIAAVRPEFYITDRRSLQTIKKIARAGNGAAHIVTVGQDAGPIEMEDGLSPLDLRDFSENKLPRSDFTGGAYIVFTSGSTGEPKGVVGDFNSLCHIVNWEIKALGVDSDWRVAQLTMPGVDTLLRDLLVPLCAGATVCIPDDKNEILDMRKFIAWLDRYRVNLIHCVPSLFSAMANYGPQKEQLQALKCVVTCGEALQVADVKNWRRIYRDRVRLVNLYGTSETNLAKMYHCVSEKDVRRFSISIGKGMPGVKAIVMDKDGRLCPPGIVGELYIRSPYMAKGYLDSENTGEKFIPNPLSRSDDMVYKTGDMGRLGHDGAFYFSGRKDRQVKLRGIRIELDEIEQHLLTHKQISQTAVSVFQHKSGSRIVAYIVPKDDLPPAEEIREYLRQRLPNYMVPSNLVILENLPLLPGGKLNRRALPDPGESQAMGDEIAPRTAVERVIAEIWAEMLGVKRVSVRDSFFNLGGHSLLATQVISEIQELFRLEIPLRRLFEEPTVEKLAQAIVEISGNPAQVEKIAQVLLEVDALSEEQAEKILEED